MTECYFCHGDWGACTCQWSEGDGFSYGAMFIDRPNLSVDTTEFVDPTIYYGPAFITWADASVENARVELRRRIGDRNLDRYLDAADRCDLEIRSQMIRLGLLGRDDLSDDIDRLLDALLPTLRRIDTARYEYGP